MDGLPVLAMDFPWQGLAEVICRLDVGPDWLHRNGSIVDIGSEVVESTVDVFGSGSEFLSDSHLQGAAVVFEDSTMDFGMAPRDVQADFFHLS